jgi:arsenical pump membrane protein
MLAAAGLASLVVAAVLSPPETRSAAAQVWSPFVLVVGLLLVGLVANDDGLFTRAGHLLARTARSGAGIFVGTTVLVATVTALLNLDTAVVFLTPVMVYTARSRDEGEGPLLYGCLLLANAASLFLPGSNLTNLIVLGHLRMTGGQFLAHMWAPGLAAVVVTAAIVGGSEHRALRVRADDLSPAGRPVGMLGVAAVVIATALVLLLRSPALPVMAVGVVAVTARVGAGRARLDRVIEYLGLPVLIGLFGVAVALGTLGRVWAGPSTLLSHLDAWGTAAVAAGMTAAVNNLPAAALLAAHHPPHPFALLVGLNVGPNVLVTGSLAWFLWLRAARSAGARPSLGKASRLGLVAVPLSVAAAVALLVASGST